MENVIYLLSEANSNVNEIIEATMEGYTLSEKHVTIFSKIMDFFHDLYKKYLLKEISEVVVLNNLYEAYEVIKKWRDVFDETSMAYKTYNSIMDIMLELTADLLKLNY